MNEFVLGALEKGKIDLDCSSGRNTSPLKPEELVFETDSTVEGHVKTAIDNFSKITGEHELIVCASLLISGFSADNLFRSRNSTNAVKTT